MDEESFVHSCLPATPLRTRGTVTRYIDPMPMPLAMFAMPLGLTTYQKPPWSLTCWHMIWPGF